jgi:multimeric flavodoxin WrbA
MKIIGLVGSPRKDGNIDILLQKALEGAKAQGNTTAIYYLNDKNIHGCQACGGCKKAGKCIVEDGLTEIFSAINEADSVIIGSPIYFGRFTSQTAQFMDRLFGYLKPDFSSSLSKGKKFALIFTQTQPDSETYKNTIAATAQQLERIGFTSGPKPLVGTGLPNAGMARENKQLLEAAYNLGQELARR